MIHRQMRILIYEGELEALNHHLAHRKVKSGFIIRGPYPVTISEVFVPEFPVAVEKAEAKARNVYLTEALERAKEKNDATNR